MKHGKRVLSVVLCLLMLVAFLVPAMAENNVIEGDMANIHYILNIDTGVLNITGSGVIPTSAFINHSSVKTVSIGNGITTIGDSAFYQCINLTKVSIPETVRTIRKSAFARCYNLENISLPQNINTIEENAFNYCENLTYLSIPEQVTNIADNAFSYCSSLKEVVLPMHVERIGAYAFSGCSNLKTINMPERLVTINEQAFSGCKSLTAITFPAGLSFIGFLAFQFCSSLKNVIIPNSVQQIEYGAFYGCSDLTEVLFSTNVREVSYSMFYDCSHLSNFLVPSGVETIEYEAFCNCSYMRELYIPKSVVSIQYGGVAGCSRLKDIYYEGTREEWEAIDVDSYRNDALLNATIHYNADPSIWNPIAENIYNLGEETYRFHNYSDDHAGGHCFGMSATSSGYYNRLLDMNIIGGISDTLYDYEDYDDVRAPICYYQARQGSRATASIVAGGSYYKTDKNDIASDWPAVVNYVKNHGSDNKGTLQIGYRGQKVRDGQIVSGGHAINFLYYDNVNGQDRIYAYDNNHPDEECYFYQDANGNVHQTPYTSYPISIDCICLRDMTTYFSLVGQFDPSKVVYTIQEEATIDGLKPYYMEEDNHRGEPVMYELPENLTQVTIKPLVDHAQFTYLDKVYTFGEIDEDTYGTLSLAADESGTGTLTIENAPGDEPQPHTHTYTAAVTTDPTCSTDGETTYTCSICGDTYTEPIPATGEHIDADNDGYCDTCNQKMTGGNHCKYCGQVHSGPFGWLIKFFHSILAIFKR